MPGVYILFIHDTNHTYVGQSVNLSIRIRTHLHISYNSINVILSTQKETQGGKHETCIVNEDTKDILQI